ncbi:MAG: energy transducer TonB [Pseudopedobacter saltans]|uniref:Energy transducer TonB n=1 Tax=Pseudopedobacter saltans TaxID=151895 RepID=A0A2W5EZA8_9SPHI|nr:MAG: energy transducer TonB [Pseudopedobacter saltans]
METNKILQANLLDLVFDGRNKDYGAYELRKSYNKRVVTSLGIVMGSLACFIVINLVHGKNKTIKPSETNTVFTLTTVSTKPIDVKKDKPKEKPHNKTPFKQVSKDPVKLTVKRNVEPIIVPDEIFDPTKNVKKAEELANVKTGRFEQIGKDINVTGPTIKVEGIGGNSLGSQDPSDHNGGTGTGEKAGGDIVERGVDKEAQYSSGKQGWINYLHRSLRSDVPAENGAPAGRNYTVLVSFVVDVDGTVSNVVAENDPGYGTATEAVRAIKNSGKWTPALQNGKKVKYRQRQQITFQVTTEE